MSATGVDGRVVLVVLVVDVLALVGGFGTPREFCGFDIGTDDADGVLGDELHPASTSATATGAVSSTASRTRRGIPSPSIRAPLRAPLNTPPTYPAHAPRTGHEN
jgi:hypothetical protein